MIKSMTGFGAADGEVGGARVSVELRSVNHRFFNPSIKLPNELSKWEGDVREGLRKGISRGHVTLFARVERRQEDAAALDPAQVAAYLHQIRAIERDFGFDPMTDLSPLLRLPNVVASSGDESQGTAAELVAIVERAVSALDQMRTSEGRRLAAYLDERLSIIEQAVGRIAVRAPQRLVEQRERLRSSIKELAEGVAVDDQRLAQEVAILADRLDVAEELSRFHSHFAAFRSTLASASPDGVGKRLGFLLQELLREANTTGSKANDSTIQHEVILIKEELERIREQVENLE